MELIKLAIEELKRTKEELGRMLEEATKLINFLNTKNKNQLGELGIRDRIGKILEIKKVLTKKSLMQNLERRFLNMQEEIDDFMKKFGVLQSKGLPSPLVINEKLMT